MTNVIPDFGTVEDQKPPLIFMIHGETFSALPTQPAGVLFDLAEMSEAKTVKEQIDLFSAFLGAMLVPESWERLKLRMRDAVRPVTMAELMRMIEWLMEQYGGRPTQGSTLSSASPDASGTTLTAGVPLGT